MELKTTNKRRTEMSTRKKPATIIVKEGVMGSGNSNGNSDKGHDDGRTRKKTDQHVKICCSRCH